MWEVEHQVGNFARGLQTGGMLGNLEYAGIAPGIISVNVMADLKGGEALDLLSLLVKTSIF